MDFIELPAGTPTPLSGSEKPLGNVLHAVEYVTEFCLGISCASQNTTVVLQLLHLLQMLFPGAKKIIADNGASFRSGQVVQYTAQRGLAIRFTSNYYPEANGKVEKVNGLVKSTLKKIIPNSTWKTWPYYYHFALHEYNNTPNMFGYSPFELLFNIARVPSPAPPSSNPEIMALQNFTSTDLNNDEDVDQFVLSLDSVGYRYLQAQSVKGKRSNLYDQKFIARHMLQLLKHPHVDANTCSVGQVVLLRRHQKRSKLDASFHGPFIINGVRGDSYSVVNLDGKERKGSYNIRDIRPYYQAYGTPFHSISDYTAKLGDKERRAYKNFWKSVITAEHHALECLFNLQDHYHSMLHD